MNDLVKCENTTVTETRTKYNWSCYDTGSGKYTYYSSKCDYCGTHTSNDKLIRIGKATICQDCYDATNDASNTGIPGYQDFEKILKMDQSKLKRYLKKRLRRLDYDPILGDGYLYAKGDVPVLLIAHLDTVHDTEPEVINVTGGVVWSPQGIGGDDRCGVYAILRIIQENKCSVLFCEDEEIGCVGAGKFAKTELCKAVGEDINFMVEIDRKGNNDLVYYSNANTAFKNWCTEVTGYKTNWGSCSDISKLMPAMNRAGVNISSGYYDEHTLKHKIVLADLEKTIEAVKKLVTTEVPSGPFHYIASTINYGGYGGMYGRWDDYYDDDYYGYGSYYANSGGYKKNKEENEEKIKGSDYKYGINPTLDVKGKRFTWYTTDGAVLTETVYGITEAAIFGSFFLAHPTVCYDDIFSFEEI